MTDIKPYIKDFSQAGLVTEMERLGEPKYRAEQILLGILTNEANSFADIPAIPKSLIEKLSAGYELFSLKLADKRQSADGSVKFLFTLNDGKSIETVFIPQAVTGRKTLCISSQAGCALGCAFCATAKLGFGRNLTQAEILDQIIFAWRETGVKPTNIVWMGMGEPLLNYENVTSTINMLTNPKWQLIPPKKITVSTSGIIPGIMRLADDAAAGAIPSVKLALSLHATTAGFREKIIPINKKYKLSDVCTAMEYYYRQTKAPITYEYILFADESGNPLNFSEVDARRLAKTAKRVPSRVNLIPFNDVTFIPDPKSRIKLLPASSEQVEEFAAMLKSMGAAVTVRVSYGRDIQAACGQLALSEREK